jgi:hypothetical protein
MRFAYSDPPYPGANRYAHEQPVDHALLIKRMCAEFPDGWALSTSSPALKLVLPLCPPETRVMAWVKPFAVFKRNVNPAYAWEPVLVWRGRKQTTGPGIATVRDWCAVNITLQKGLVGVKPEAFCHWLFAVLGARPGDELADLYPGSGAVTRAWTTYLETLTKKEAA